jgi:glycerol-3-phosphate acyltransferase PlsY
MSWILCTVVAYFVGTIPSAMVIAGRRGHDPTIEGSGNPGASNVLRLAGTRAGVSVFLVDLAKGAAATGLGLAVGGRGLGALCWAAAIIGHIAPITRHFQGGKGVATGGGGALVLFPVVGLVCVVVFAVSVVVLKLPSVGSLAMVVTLMIGVVAVGRPGWEIAVTAALCTIVTIRHRSNIARLVSRSENRFDRGDVR